MATFTNPFRPGAGHPPPHLAGRKEEEAEFRRLLKQETVTENLVLTGLRGVGKTVLLESFKPLAMRENWLWVGTDLSESASISEENLATRLITDLSVITSTIPTGTTRQLSLGFTGKETQQVATLDYQALVAVLNGTPGLIADRIKAVFLHVAPYVKQAGRRGIIFAYDEAQNLADHAQRHQFPLSILLDVFQSIQRQGVPFVLLLVGLPTLFPKLVEARTYAERMFHVIFLKQLDEPSSRDAIIKPVAHAKCPVKFTDQAIALIVQHSGGYPYFIQFMCREAYDAFIQKIDQNEPPRVPMNEIVRKLDTDFFAGRWARVTDRQQELLHVVASLDSANEEFTVQEILERSKQMLKKPFGRSHINQMLASLILSGLIYRDRHGKYLFAVPLMAGFILRAMAENAAAS
jgi:hypothetical protein